MRQVEWAWSRWPPRPLEAAGGRGAEAENFFFSDMAMWGMLLWVIECARSKGHGLDGLRVHWRPLEAAGGQEFFSSDMAIWSMLLWDIECAKLNGHGLDGLRGHWRPLEAERPRPIIFFFQI